MATVTQPGKFSLLQHRSWEDWVSMALGVLVLFSPWVSDTAFSTAMMITTGFVGFVIIAMAGLELVSLRRWEEAIEFLCGAWLIASPFVFGYAGALRWWHLAIGALIALLSLFELWQDRGRKLED